jgi:hypothetical protein
MPGKKKNNGDLMLVPTPSHPMGAFRHNHHVNGISLNDINLLG